MVVAGLVSVSGSLMQRVMVVAGLVSVSGSLTQRVIKAEAARASASSCSLLGDPCFASESCPADVEQTAIVTTWSSEGPCELGSSCSLYVEAVHVWATSVRLNNPCGRPVVLFVAASQAVPLLLQRVIDECGLRVERVSGEGSLLVLNDTTSSTITSTTSTSSSRVYLEDFMKASSPPPPPPPPHLASSTIAALRSDFLRSQLLNNVTSYKRLLALDADLVVLRPLEPLFRLPPVPIAIVDNTPTDFNSGVMLFAPSRHTYNVALRMATNECGGPGSGSFFTQSCWEKLLRLPPHTPERHTRAKTPHFNESTCQPYTPAWAPIDPSFRTKRIISMGLGKTGSTSVGWALVKAGLRVAHNQGDDLMSDTCQAVVCCTDYYNVTFNKHPDAKWVVSYTANFSRWHKSIRDYVHRNQMRTYEKATHLPCGAFGCEMALTPEIMRQAQQRRADGGGGTTGVNVHTLVALDPSTKWVREGRDMALLEELYRSYYTNLFAFLDENVGVGKYAVVDLRANDYKGLDNLGLGSRLATPFPISNQLGDKKNNPGSSWYGKTTCCQGKDWWKNPCPEEQMADVEGWAWCEARSGYVPRGHLRNFKC